MLEIKNKLVALVSVNSVGIILDIVINYFNPE